MNVLVVGSGGREHALVWKLAQSSKVSTCYVAPGNAGTAREYKAENVDINPLDFDKLIEFAKEKHVSLTIVGGEQALAAGIVDEFQKHRLPCFGPTKNSAELETSKAFCKEFLKRYNIPTAEYSVFTDPQSAKDYVRNKGTPLVIKADGLVDGQGVEIVNSPEQADKVIDDMFSGKLGNAGDTVVIEQFLVGTEISYIIMIDGENILPFSSIRDFKRLKEGEQGPATRGMGAYSPTPIVTPELDDRIMHTIIMPTINGLKEENRIYQGFLYAGVMVSSDGQPYVLEYNCRLGDPEAQALMLRLEDDLYSLLKAAIEKRLDEIITQWDPRPAVCVVMASEGYPNQYPTGEIIQGLPQVDSSEVKVFHDGTNRGNDNQVFTSGGRVLSVAALGEDFADAKTRAYDIVNHINWEHKFFRTDIGLPPTEISK